MECARPCHRINKLPECAAFILSQPSWRSTVLLPLQHRVVRGAPRRQSVDRRSAVLCVAPHGGHSRFRTLLNHVPEPKCKQPVRAWIWMQTIGDRTCSIPKSKDVNSSVFRVAMASPEILYHRAVLRVESGKAIAKRAEFLARISALEVDRLGQVRQVRH